MMSFIKSFSPVFKPTVFVRLNKTDQDHKWILCKRHYCADNKRRRKKTLYFSVVNVLFAESLIATLLHQTLHFQFVFSDDTGLEVPVFYLMSPSALVFTFSVCPGHSVLSHNIPYIILEICNVCKNAQFARMLPSKRSMTQTGRRTLFYDAGFSEETDYETFYDG